MSRVPLNTGPIARKHNFTTSLNSSPPSFRMTRVYIKLAQALLRSDQTFSRILIESIGQGKLDDDYSEFWKSSKAQDKKCQREKNVLRHVAQRLPKILGILFGSSKAHLTYIYVPQKQHKSRCWNLEFILFLQRAVRTTSYRRKPVFIFTISNIPRGPFQYHPMIYTGKSQFNQFKREILSIESLPPYFTFSVITSNALICLVPYFMKHTLMSSVSF